tara:strand:- start:5364 stop:5723 length:360 start_codon:yes stop_codon:yes gene_type:complete
MKYKTTYKDWWGQISPTIRGEIWRKIRVGEIESRQDMRSFKFGAITIDRITVIVNHQIYFAIISRMKTDECVNTSYVLGNKENQFISNEKPVNDEEETATKHPAKPRKRSGKQKNSNTP